MGILPASNFQYALRNKLENNWDDELVKIERNGFVLFYPSKSIIGMQAATFGFRPTFEKLFAQYIKNPRVIVEVGANIGRDTLLLAKMSPDVHVFAFEPVAKFKTILEKNVSANNVKNISVHGDFVSSRVGDEIAINVATHSASVIKNTSVHFPAVSTEILKTTTLDAFFAEHPIDRLDLLKTDTDGADEEVLNGAAGVITRFRPYIFSEFSGYCLEKFGTSLENLARRISDFGYNEFLLLDGTREPVRVKGYGALLDLIDPMQTVDVFAIPPA